MDAAARRSMFLRSLLLQACWNEAGMQNLGFALALDPWLRRLHPDGGAGLAEARLRHLGFFNTQPHMAGVALGVTARLEADLAARTDDPAAAARIGAVKSALGATMAGIGDALFWGTLKPLAALGAVAAAIAARLAGAPLAAACAGGAALYLAVFNVPAVWLRWWGLGLGYDQGEGVAAGLKRAGFQRWMRSLRRAGLALAALLAAGAVLAPSAGMSPWTRGALLAGCFWARRLGIASDRIYAALAVCGCAAAGLIGCLPPR